MSLVGREVVLHKLTLFQHSKGWRPTLYLPVYAPSAHAQSHCDTVETGAVSCGRCQVGLVRSSVTSMLMESNFGLTAGSEGGDVSRLAISFGVDPPQGWHQSSTLFCTVQIVYLVIESSLLNAPFFRQISYAVACVWTFEKGFFPKEKGLFSTKWDLKTVNQT